MTFPIRLFLAAFLCAAAVVSTRAADDTPDIVIERAPDTPDASVTQADTEDRSAEIADLRTKLQSAQATIEVLTTKNQQLDATLAARTNELREVKTLLATADTRVKELSTARGTDSANADALAAEKARADEATTRLNTLVAGAARIQDEKAALEAQLATARQNETQLREQLTAAPKPDPELPKKLAALEAQLSETRRAQAVVQAENDVLRAAADDHTQNAAALQTLRQEKTTLEAQLAQLRQSESALREQLAAAADRPDPATPSPEIAARLADLEDKLSTSLRSYSLLQQENDRLKNASTESEKLAAELESLRAEKTELESRLAAQPPADLAQKFAAAENKLNTTLRSFSQLQAENDRLKSSAADATRLQAELDSLRADHAALESRVAATPATEAGAATPSADLTQKLADTEDRLATTLRSYSQLQAENDRLKNEASRTSESAHVSAERTASDNAAQMAALYDELRQTKAQLASLAVENSQLKTRVALSGPPPGSSFSTPTRPGFARPAVTDTTAPATPAAPANASGPREHTVVLGDTLAKISRQYYGTAGRWDEILEANSDVIQNENALTVGTTLRIP